MKAVEVESITVQGLKVRTTNSAEMNQKTQKIGPLWGEFYNKVHPTLAKGSTVYSVYGNYESDFRGEFDVLLGSDTLSMLAYENSIRIEKGKYLVFEVKGELPQGIIETWGKIWEYFSSTTTKEKRAYKTDFERYTPNDEVDIYIGIK